MNDLTTAGVESENGLYSGRMNEKGRATLSVSRPCWVSLAPTDSVLQDE